MKGKIFKKALLLVGIFLLSTFMFAQLSWGCDDDDKGDRDCHDKRDCDDHDRPCHPPKIQRVFLDYKDNSIVFKIWGKNFDRGAPLVVTLGGLYDLTVDEDSTDDNKITATLSPITDFEFGDYRLVVSTCHDSACKDKHCKDHGPNCKCKYCKDHCSKCKDNNCKDDERKCRCKDRYSLTIAGPPGPPSPITLARESASFPLPGTSEGTTSFDLSAVCRQGGLVTGGGFSCPDCSPFFPSSPEFPLRIRVNEPLRDLSGWHVAGDYVDGDSAELTVYAICAQGQ